MAPLFNDCLLYHRNYSAKHIRLLLMVQRACKQMLKVFLELMILISSHKGDGVFLGSFATGTILSSNVWCFLMLHRAF